MYFSRNAAVSHGSINLQDMKIEDPEIVEVVNQIEELEWKLHAHPLHKVCHIIQNQLPFAYCSYKILLGSKKVTAFGKLSL